MPKPTSLHSKGKPTSMQKQCSKDKSSLSSYNDTEHENAVRQFELELCWCIQQLERTLQHTNKNASERCIQETWKVLQVLKNNNQPIIRKRQLMHSHFGDYRAKMLAEEKKLAKMAGKMKIVEKPDQPKATFLRKSAFQTTGDSAFRFNFNLAPEQVDADNTDTNVKTENATSSRNETRRVGNRASSGDGAKPVQTVAKDNSKDFKFSFSGSDFRFNFDIDKP